MNICSSSSQPSESSPFNGSSDIQNKPCQAFCNPDEAKYQLNTTNDVQNSTTNGQSVEAKSKVGKKTTQSASTKPRRPSKQLYTPPAAKAASPEPDHQSHCGHSNTISDPPNDSFAAKNTSNSSIKPVSDSTQVQNIPEKVHNETDEDASWDALYDDSGDLIKCDLAKSLQSSLNLDDETTHKLHYERPVSDFTDYASSSINHIVDCDQIDNEAHPHVLEVYQFSSELKTKDIFSRISSSG